MSVAADARITSFPRKRESTWDEAGEGGETAPVSLHAALLEATAEVRGSHMSLAEGAVKATLAGEGGLSASAFTTKGIRGRTPAVGAALGWRRPGSPLGLRAGWIGERETLLGSVGEGAFGTLAGDTSFVGVDAHTDLGGWRVGANAELGLVSPAGAWISDPDGPSRARAADPCAIL